MSRRRTKTLTPFAFAPWGSLGWQAAEMMLASAQVMTHRMTRLQSAQFPLSARDTAEFLLMSQEKAEAATESLIALSQGLMMQSTPFTLTRTIMKPYRTRAMANAKRLGRTNT